MNRLLKKSLLILTAALCTVPVFAGGWVEKKDIPYYDKDFKRVGDSAYIDERCKLDLIYPADTKNFTTIVIFHGGGIIRGRKHRYKFMESEGRAYAYVNYRLSGKRAQCPDYIYDAAAAVAWVMRHIKEYGGDPERVVMAGHSAGGYLTAMVTLDERYLNHFGYSPKQLFAAMPSSPQLTTHFTILNERRRKGETVPQVVIDEYAPMSYIKKDTPPMMLIVGDNATEIAGRVGENYMFHSLMVKKAKNANVEMFQLPGFTHGNVWRPATQKLFYWLGQLERSAARREARAEARAKARAEARAAKK